MATSQAYQPLDPETSPEVRAAVSDLSLAVQRALLRVLQHRQAQTRASRARTPWGIGATGATAAVGATGA